MIDQVAIKNKLKQLKTFLKNLKDQGLDLDVIDKLLNEIEILEPLLASDEEEDILESVEQLAAIVEKMSALGDKVPLLGTFLELYATALRSVRDWAEFVSTHRFGSLGIYCPHYCGAREQKEKELRDEDPDRSDDEIAEEAHKWAGRQLGADLPGAKVMWEAYEEEFKKQYEKERIKKRMQDELDRVAEKKKKEETPDPEPMDPELAKFLRIIGRMVDALKLIRKRMKQIEDRLKEGDLTPEERRQLEAELERLRDYARGLAG